MVSCLAGMYLSVVQCVCVCVCVWRGGGGEGGATFNFLQSCLKI